MKNLFGKILIVMLVISACEGPMGPAGRDGIDGEVTYWEIIDFTVRRTGDFSWMQIGEDDEIGSYLYFVLEDERITQQIFDEGLVICYYRYMDEFGYNVQTPLPFTIYDIVVDEGGEGEDYYYFEYPYSVQFSYDVEPGEGSTPGSIAIKVVISNFFTNHYWNIMPPACRFRLHLLL